MKKRKVFYRSREQAQAERPDQEIFYDPSEKAWYVITENPNFTVHTQQVILDHIIFLQSNTGKWVPVTAKRAY